MLEIFSVALTKRLMLGGPKPKLSLEVCYLLLWSIFTNIVLLHMLLQAMVWVRAKSSYHTLGWRHFS